MRPIVLIVTLGVALPAAAEVGDSQVIVILPTANAAGASAAVARAAEAALAKLDVGPTLSGRALRKKLRKNPATLVKKCRGEATCLARVGARAGAASVLSARISRSEAGQTRIVVYRVDVASATRVASVEIAVRNAGEVGKKLPARVASLWSTGATKTATVKKEEKGPPSDEVTPAGDAEDKPTVLASSEGTDSPADDAAATADAAPGGQGVTTDVTTVTATGDSPGPPLKTGSYQPGVLLWAGAGGVVVGGAVAGIGFYFGSRARDLRTLDPKSSQLDALTQQDEQNRDATLANWLVPTGIALMLGGLSAAALDYFMGRLEWFAVNIHDDGASAGVAFTW